MRRPPGIGGRRRDRCSRRTRRRYRRRSTGGSTRRSVPNEGHSADVVANTAGAQPGCRASPALRHAANCASSTTRTPASRSARAATPYPGTSAPENVPSYTNPLPHEGLFAFSTASVQPRSRTSSVVLAAPGQKRVRGIAPVRVHHAQSTLGGDDLARRARHGQPSERLRAHAHKFVRRAQPQHGLARPRLPVEAARLAQQTRAHGYRHGAPSIGILNALRCARPCDRMQRRK